MLNFYCLWDVNRISGTTMSRDEKCLAVVLMGIFEKSVKQLRGGQMEKVLDTKANIEFGQLTEMMKLVVPEFVELLELRFNILRFVSYNQPIGRRNLSAKLEVTERILRKEANFLKESGLLDFSTEGMSITDKGEDMLEYADLFFYGYRGLKEKERRLERMLGIKKVHVVPASDSNDQVLLRDIKRDTWFPRFLQVSKKIKVENTWKIASLS